jgi:hypothetical protein
MKTKLGVLLVVLLTSIILGAAQPARLYACETGGSTTPWDTFVDTNPLGGNGVKSINGTLTVIYNPLAGWLPNFFQGACTNGQATMFYSVRLTYKKKPYTYEGASNVCMGDFGSLGTGGQGDVIYTFMTYVMMGYFPNDAGLTVSAWNVKSLKNAGAGQYSFIGDIEIQFIK